MYSRICRETYARKCMCSRGRFATTTHECTRCLHSAKMTPRARVHVSRSVRCTRFVSGGRVTGQSYTHLRTRAYRRVPISKEKKISQRHFSTRRGTSRRTRLLDSFGSLDIVRLSCIFIVQDTRVSTGDGGGPRAPCRSGLVPHTTP